MVNASCLSQQPFNPHLGMKWQKSLYIPRYYQHKGFFFCVQTTPLLRADNLLDCSETTYHNKHKARVSCALLLPC